MPYFELHINCFINNNTPLEIVHTLQYMISKERLNEPEYVKISKAELFKNELWKIFLIRDNPHFPFVNSSYLGKNNSFRFIFSVSSSFFSKDNKIIFDFIDWLKPYLDGVNNFIGYYREFEKEPILLYKS